MPCTRYQVSDYRMRRLIFTPTLTSLVLLYSNLQARHSYLTISPGLTMLQQRELQGLLTRTISPYMLI